MNACQDCGATIRAGALRCHPCAVSYGMRFIVRKATHDKICTICGIAYKAFRSDSTVCSSSCSSVKSQRVRVAKAGGQSKRDLMPAEPILDGKRRCRWCQCEITGRKDKRTCSVVHRKRVIDHNAGKTASSTVMSRRL